MKQYLYQQKSNYSKKSILLWFCFITLYLYPINFLMGTTFWRNIQVDLWRIAIITLLFFFLITCLPKRKSLYLSLSRLDLLLYFFILSISISFFWSLYPIETARYTFDIYFLILLYFVLINLNREKRNFFSYGNFFLFLPLVIFTISIIIIVKYGDLRPEKTEVESIPNILASASELSIPILLFFLFTRTDSVKKIFAIVGLVLSIVNAILAQARGSLLTIALEICLFFIIIMIAKPIRFARPLKVLAYITIIVFAVSFFLTNTGIGRKTYGETLNRIQKTTLDINKAKKHKQDIVRNLFYKYSVDVIIKQKWMLGIGYGAFNKNMEMLFGKGTIPHNFIIEIVSSIGILGLLLFLVLLLNSYRNFLKYYSTLKKEGQDENSFFILSLICCYTGLLFHAMFRPFLDNPLLYVFLALASAAKYHATFSHTKSLASEIPEESDKEHSLVTSSS